MRQESRVPIEKTGKVEVYDKKVNPGNVDGMVRASNDESPKSACAVDEGRDNRYSPPEREFPMLVLSRKLGEKIVISDNIIVTVVKIDRNQIRLGIEAPLEVSVYREEISPNRATKAVVDEATLSR
jgi:carbon storage regulator